MEDKIIDKLLASENDESDGQADEFESMRYVL